MEDQINEWGDREDHLSEAIMADHPMTTGDHDTYAEAQQLVSNRHSKSALIHLVNHLLAEIKRLKEGTK